MQLKTLLWAVISLTISVNAYWLEDIKREDILKVALGHCQLTVL